MPTTQQLVEGVLFLSEKPLSATQIAEKTNTLVPEILDVLLRLKQEYAHRGITLLEQAGTFQFVTHPDCAQIIKTMMETENQAPLSTVALETLSVLAYRGPLTKPELEFIRGVQCGTILRYLLIRGLIQKSSAQKHGQSCFEVTPLFLQHLGLTSLDQLPRYQELHTDFLPTSDTLINPV